MIIILNAISFISLGFVLFIYILRWKNITSFPLRLVEIYLTFLVILLMSYLFDTKSVCPYAQSYPRLEVSRYLKLSLFWLLRVRRSGQSLFGSVLNHLDNFDYLLKLCFNRPKKIFRSGIAFIPCSGICVSHYNCRNVIVFLGSPVFFKIYGFNTYFCWFDG